MSVVTSAGRGWVVWANTDPAVARRRSSRIGHRRTTLSGVAKAQKQNGADRLRSTPFFPTDKSLYSKRKLTSIWASTVTGFPSLVPGLNFHFFTASIAFSSRPRPKLCKTRMFTARPLGSTWTYSSTVPWYFALRASSEYSGSILVRSWGAVTPPPTRNTPPPTPPPSPGPKPPPLPGPTPPPEPLPMPPPDPGPFEGGPIFAKGSPH